MHGYQMLHYNDTDIKKIFLLQNNCSDKFMWHLLPAVQPQLQLPSNLLLL